MKFDKIIHEPTRLRIMMILAGLEQADFNFLDPFFSSKSQFLEGTGEGAVIFFLASC